MIRRNSLAADGSPRWVLISQIEHARLAADLARHWGANGFAAVSPEMMQAIEHHDDGWTEWETTPDVDPQTGRPLQFIEMPPEVALDIWRGSIERCERFGPLAAWSVAGHFSALLRGSVHVDDDCARSWLFEFDRRRAAWLAEWRANDAGHTVAIAEQALRQLQLFDGLSLWLCCAERTQPQTMIDASGTTFSLTPRTPRDIEIAPWPLTVPELSLSATGEAIPATAYENRASLAQTKHEPASLAWRCVQRKV